MAIYHLSGQIMSRSQGRSAIAAAAYRAAEKMIDLRTELEHDYTKKASDVFYKEILLPEGAPERLKDREKLWNEVEKSENRKDAQVAREFNITLPKELTEEQNIILAREFVQNEFVNQGMIADLCLHRGQGILKTSDGDISNEGSKSSKHPKDTESIQKEKQPHIHVMLTLREVSEEGFGKKAREWNDRSQLEVWREAWEEHANRHLALNGHDIRIDHRSNEEQGINLEPQYKIGAKVAEREMARYEDHQRIARENGEKIFANPEIALNAITRQQSTFTHHDLAKFINRHTADAEQFQRVYEKVKFAEQMIYLGNDEQGRERFTTQEMQVLERSMLANAECLQQCGFGKSVIAHGIPIYLDDEQRDVVKHIVAGGDIKCVIGYAGSGKSTLLNIAREAWEREGYSVHGVTLSGIAAESLSGASGIASRTVASRLYYWDRGEQLLTNKDILVIDEAGMLGSRQMARILQEAREGGAKVVLIGDPQQLQAIEAGAAFRAIAEEIGYVELTQIYRQYEKWQQQATKELAQSKVDEALDRYRKHDHLHEFETQAYAKQGLVEMWNDVRISQPDKTQIILAYTRQDVKDLNEMARDLRRANDELGQDHIIQTVRGERQFAENDRIYFLKNERGLGVMNGTLGTIEKIEGNQITVCLDKDLENPNRHSITVDTNFYNHLEHGYAATIHKSQGVTIDRSYLLLSKHLDKHAAYVGMGRHRESTDLFWGKDEFANQRELARALNRDRSKDVTLDYGYSETQGGENDLELGKKKQALDVVLEQDKVNEIGKTSEISGAALNIIEITDEAEDKEHRVSKQKRELSQSQGFGKTDDEATQKQDPLQLFKEQYEAQHPERAREIQRSLQPADERRALEAEREIDLLERAIAKTHTPKTYENKLEKYACKIAKDESVMNYFNVNNPELAEKIFALVKEREYKRELALENRLEREQGISY